MFVLPQLHILGYLLQLAQVIVEKYQPCRPILRPTFHLEELNLSWCLGLGLVRYVVFKGNGTN